MVSALLDASTKFVNAVALCGSVDPELFRVAKSACEGCETVNWILSVASFVFGPVGLELPFGKFAPSSQTCTRRLLFVKVSAAFVCL